MQMKIPGIKLHSFATTFIFLHTYANQNKVSILLPVPLGDLKINDLCLDVYCTLWTKQSARFIENYQTLWFPYLYEVLKLVYCTGQSTIFFNRRYSLLSEPQLYNSEDLPFTYGQFVVIELADKLYNSDNVCFCASGKYVFHIGCKWVA